MNNDKRYINFVKNLDKLLKRDKLREKDGLPRKIKIGHIIKPGKNGKQKIIVVPVVQEEKLVHDKNFKQEKQLPDSSGAGEGEVGDVIGRRKMEGQSEGDDGSQGGDGNAGHQIESEAYELGKTLTEQFNLPNLKDKGKKTFVKYIYELTDRHDKTGQILDKKQTLKKIVKTNINILNKVPLK